MCDEFAAIFGLALADLIGTIKKGRLDRALRMKFCRPRYYLLYVACIAFINIV